MTCPSRERRPRSSRCRGCFPAAWPCQNQSAPGLKNDADHHLHDMRNVPRVAPLFEACVSRPEGKWATLRIQAWSPTMNPSLFTPNSGPLLALASAALFGASTPVSKLLLGATDPLLLAGLLYLGSGIGLGIIGLGARLSGIAAKAPLHRRDLPWLGVIVLSGGVLG